MYFFLKNMLYINNGDVGCIDICCPQHIEVFTPSKQYNLGNLVLLE